MNSHKDIVEWYRGSGLRPFLNMLPDDEHKNAFCEEYEKHISAAYAVAKNGTVLMPFTRVFFTAYKECVRK
jgi:trans-aconitate 2-methyltransferase